MRGGFLWELFEAFMCDVVTLTVTERTGEMAAPRLQRRPSDAQSIRSNEVTNGAISVMNNSDDGLRHVTKVLVVGLRRSLTQPHRRSMLTGLC